MPDGQRKSRGKGLRSLKRKDRGKRKKEEKEKKKTDRPHPWLFLAKKNTRKKKEAMENEKVRDSYRAMWTKTIAVGGCLGLICAIPIALMTGEGPILILGLILGILGGYGLCHWAPMDLSDWQIAALKSVITPMDISLVEPDSYDVTLGEEFTKIKKDGTLETYKAEEIILKPGECLLAHTEQTFKFPNNLKGTLQGKSSWARLSVFVECAGLFDKGFEGTAVLELYNAGEWGVKLKKGDRIAQMIFHRTLPAAIPYGQPRKSHYQGQAGAKRSWLAKENRLVPV